MKWSLLLCEGAHDQEFLCCLATIAGGWMHPQIPPSWVPDTFKKQGNAIYLHLQRDENAIVIAGLNGIGNMIPCQEGSGERGKILVDAAKHASAIGIIVDADGVGAESRVNSIRNHYGPVVPSATSATHGTFQESPSGSLDSRKFGLWIAPNGVDSGSLDSVILTAANQIHPELVQLATNYIADLGTSATHPWGLYKEKAAMGALGQLWQAGGSLASAISKERNKWVVADFANRAPFQMLLRFVDELAT